VKGFNILCQRLYSFLLELYQIKQLKYGALQNQMKLKEFIVVKIYKTKNKFP
jgi:hypothetical protein